ncbi:MAG TPA: phenylalanine--tRNA ligase subunit beta [Solimonas sp.]|nr:phenylalanine--tRNA ligase subunit beta [Solimonas sp.]
MKLSESWLREWVNPAASVREIADRLLMGGLELEIEPAVAELAVGVVVGRIVKAERHPQADRLQVCTVDAGGPVPLQIVCGAPNAKAGMRAPVALVGATLPGGLAITQAQLRGVDSFGMLCSAKELGLSDKSEGLLELDADARVGQPIEQHLALVDSVLNLEITPNRGDCLSVMGLARDVSALFAVQMKRPSLPPAVVVGHQMVKVEIEDLNACPNYAGRVISKLNPKARTPDWMRERLRRSGLRCIQPIVDVTNYVMLEMGQPMHAFDTAKLSGTVRVRKARKGETLKLLNDQRVELQDGELLIADDKGPLALAGVMGGIESSVTEATTSIFFESACFAPAAVSGTGRRHKLNTDASYRFERGVDPGLQRIAMDRATNLLTQICGGEVHPIVQVGRSQPEAVSVRLRHARLNRLLGHDVPAKEVEALLARLGITLRHEIGDAWIAKVPSHRTDIRIEPDLIEEVARLYGYDKLVARPYPAALAPSRPAERARPLARTREALVARGWHEAVTLSFAEPVLQQALNPDVTAVPVDNPMSEQQAVMRTTLWAGLLPAWLYNRSRQQEHVRLFETGLCFELHGEELRQPLRVGGLAAGSAFAEQWGKARRAVDFYDVKGDVEALLGAELPEFRFESAQHPALHPGQSARIVRGAQHAGWIGVLHPMAVKQLDLPEAPVVFELEWDALREQRLPKAQALSEFPSSRRDLAVVVAEQVSAQQLLDCVRASGGKTLANAFVFDIYRGEALGTACKSVALGLNFNDYSRTLTVEEIDSSIAAITQSLTRELGAAIRQ